MKTIKELADEMGIEKYAVRNLIYALELSEKLTMSGNRYLIDEEQAAVIKKAYAERTGTAETSTPNESVNPGLECLLTQIKMLFAAQSAEYERLFKEEQIQHEWLLDLKDAELARADALVKKTQNFVNALTDLLAAKTDFECTQRAKK